MARLDAQPVLYLVGPTASGKSDVAHVLARHAGAGIISADAMMVYRGMDIGTAKPSGVERAGIDYAGLDLIAPDHPFSAYEYLMAVNAETAAQGRWMVAGGTGLYIRALVSGLEDDPGMDPGMRAEAEAVLASEGFEALKDWCRSRLPDVETQLPPGDAGNPRRWIRAVERGGCRPVRRVEARPGRCIIGLRRERADLEARIVRRVEAMYRGGLLDEVATLRRRYPDWSPTASAAIGYAEANAVLDGAMPVDAAIERTVIRTRQYAKRQMTWFRHQLATAWIDVAADEPAEAVAARVQQAWESHGHTD